METQGLISRQRSGTDERKVIVALTPAGKKLKKAAAAIPEKIAAGLAAGTINIDDLVDLREKLNLLIDLLRKKPVGKFVDSLFSRNPDGYRLRLGQ
jgi:DNA-binding MarR family transcriptional regulator